MPYDEALAARIRAVVAAEPGVSEQRMFGGLGFLLDGNMAVAASSQGGLMVRVDPRTGLDEVTEHVRPMEMRGRVMTGWLHAETPAMASERDLTRLVGLGVAYARSLPPKR